MIAGHPDLCLQGWGVVPDWRIGATLAKDLRRYVFPTYTSNSHDRGALAGPLQEARPKGSELQVAARLSSRLLR